MAMTLLDDFTTPGLAGWVTVNMEASGGVMKPIDYSQDAMAVWATVSGVPGMRCEFVLGGTTMSNFAVGVRKADTVASLAANHYRFDYQLGGQSAGSKLPAWYDPDTVKLTKVVSGTPAEKPPSNTVTSILTPYLSGNRVSLRDTRLVSGVRIMAGCTDDKLFSAVNDELFFCENFSGITGVGYMFIYIYANAASDMTIDNFYGSDLTPRYVSKDAAAADTNDGSDNTTNAWATIPKMYAALATNEVGWLCAGTYTQQVKGYDTGYGSPRVPGALNDALFILNNPDDYVLSKSTIPFHAKNETKFLYLYGWELQNSSEESTNEVIKFHAGGGATSSLDCVLHGMIVRHAWDQGVLLAAGTDLQSRHKVLCCRLKGNGRQGTLYHNLYFSGQDGVIAWNEMDGLSDHPSWANLQTQGYGIHVFFSGSGNVGSNNAVVKYNVVHGHLNSASGGIILSHGNNMVCEGNLTYNNYDGITLRYNPATGIKCRNNLSRHNTARGIYVHDSSANKIDHNTCVENGTYGIYAGSGSVNDVAENNLCVDNGAGSILAHASATGWVATTNWVDANGDPLFIDPVALDYRLQITSPAKLGGLDLYTSGGVVVDRRGVLRPQYATPAFGAYEVPVTTDAAASTIATSAPSVPADGATQAIITVTLLDADLLPVVGHTVTLDDGAASSTIGVASGPSDVNGQVAFVVTNSTVEVATYTATDTTDAVVVTQTVGVNFTTVVSPPTTNAATSTVSASPATVLADGATQATITVTLLDATVMPLVGHAVVLGDGAASSTISPPSGPSGANGGVTFTVTNTTPEVATYTATDTTDGVVISQTAAVNFTAAPVQPLTPNTWPVGLPAITVGEGWANAPANTQQRTVMAEGPAKVRRNTNPKPATFEFRQLLSREETILLDTFWEDTLGGGALLWEDVHPRTQAAVTLRFVTRPTYTHASANWWWAACQIEVIR